MAVLIGNFANRANVDQSSDPALNLDSTREVLALTIGSRTFVYVAGFNSDGISVFELGADGSLSNLFNIDDDATLELDGAWGLSSATMGGVTYLYANAYNDSGLSVFQVGTDGSLTNIQNITDANPLELAGLDTNTTIVTIGNTQFLVAAGSIDDGVSVFRINSDGTLTNTANLTDTSLAALTLDGARGTATATVGGNTFVFVAGQMEDGITSLQLNASGELSFADRVLDSEDPALQLDQALSIVTATIGATTYLFANSFGAEGISVFSINSFGELTNVSNYVTEARGFMETVVIGGETFLTMSKPSPNQVELLHVDENGTLTSVTFVNDAGYELLNTQHNTTVTVNGTLYLIATGTGDDGVSVFEFGGGSNDLTGTGDADTLFGLGNSDTLFGEGGDDRLFGGSGGDFLFGGSENDTLDGGTGIDSMTGHSGNDTYYVDELGDQVNELASQGDDRIFARATYVLAANQSIELIATSQQAGTTAINLTGNNIGQRLNGNAGNNVLDGGGGIDQMYGFGGSDTFYVSHASDQVFEAAGQGTDTVYARVSYTLAAGQSIEVLATSTQAGTAAINLTGNELAQTVRGNAGNNVLDGKGGIDQLYGLGGNDTFYVNHASDQVFEVSGQGTDTVYARASYALSAGQSIEVLATYKASGTEAIHLTGNEIAQAVRGNAGNNLVNGGRGNDTLTGNAGFDTFVFDTTLSSSNNVDTITDFSVPQDSIRLENAIFTALTTTGTLAASAFHIGTAAADSLDRIIYNSTNGRLYYDADGTGAGGMSHFATLSTGLAMTNLDFVVV